MGNYTITSGVINAPMKVVLYGPEGIGKTTFASKFPDVVFIDTEGSTKKLDVKRLPPPTSWAMLMDMVNSVRTKQIPCGTLAIDTADWAEAMCIRAVCDKAGLKGIEDFGYGKGYVYVKEEFGRLLDQLDGVIAAGVNVVVTAHAQITKFEQPDEMGAYDRWTMKTSKQVAPLLREWCDMLLFANYKTIVVKDGDGRNAKSKAQGGRRMMYTNHHACWDAKNRDNLPEEMPFDFGGIQHLIPTASQQPVQLTVPQVQAEPPAVETSAKPIMVDDPAPAAEPVQPQVVNPYCTDEVLKKLKIPDNLRSLMVAAGVNDLELRKLVSDKGYFPDDMPISDYPNDFVDGCLVAAWDSVYAGILENREDLPF